MGQDYKRLKCTDISPKTGLKFRLQLGLKTGLTFELKSALKPGLN